MSGLIHYISATQSSSRPFTMVAPPMQEGLAFRSKGSIGVVADRAASARDPTAPSALADPGLFLVRPGLPDL